MSEMWSVYECNLCLGVVKRWISLSEVRRNAYYSTSKNRWLSGHKLKKKNRVDLYMTINWLQLCYGKIRYFTADELFRKCGRNNRSPKQEKPIRRKLGKMVLKQFDNVLATEKRTRQRRDFCGFSILVQVVWWTNSLSVFYLFFLVHNGHKEDLR